MKRFVLALALVISTAGIAAAGPFDPITFSLNDPNPQVAGFPNSFGGVVVDWTSPTTASIIFLANESHANAVTFGGAGAVDLNVNINGTSLVVSPISEANTLVGGGFQLLPPPTTSIGSQNIDGRGDFNVVVDNFDGFVHSATQFAFTLTNIGGTWASSSDVLVNNTLGNEVAVHAFVCALNAALCNSNSTAVATGFVADGLTGKPTQFCSNPAGCDDVTAVPEPASMFLLGSGLIGMVRLVRRKNEEEAA